METELAEPPPPVSLRGMKLRKFILATRAPKLSRRPSSWRDIIRAAIRSSRSTDASMGASARCAFAHRLEGCAAKGFRFRCFPECFTVSYPNSYRCPYGNPSPCNCVESAAILERERFFKRFYLLELRVKVAAVFIEPIQGEGGYVPAPKEFLLELQHICRKLWNPGLVSDIRGSERHGTHWEMVGGRLCGDRTRISFASRKELLQECRFRRRLRARA